MILQITFSNHALQRMQERSISESIVYDIIYDPQKLEQSQKNQQRFIAKKVYYNKKFAKNHLLVYEIENSMIKVITIIDTSKIQKYL